MSICKDNFLLVLGHLILAAQASSLSEQEFKSVLDLHYPLPEDSLVRVTKETLCRLYAEGEDLLWVKRQLELALTKERPGCELSDDFLGVHFAARFTS